MDALHLKFNVEGYRFPAISPQMPDVSPPPKAAPKQMGIWLRNKFVAGLFVVLPIAATVWIIRIIYGIINGPSDRLIRTLIKNDLLPMADYFREVHNGTIPGAGFILTLLIILLIGVLAGNFFGRQMLRIFESILDRIPVINSIYSAIKQAVEAVRNFGDEETALKFSQVAYVPFPNDTARAIGFVTGQFVNSKRELFYNVFVPTSPSPLTGFTFVVPQDKLVLSELSVEQATKIVISLGLVAPSFSTTMPGAPTPIPSDTKQTG